MEFRDLTYLLEVAETSHLRLAAERLGLTQPALTKCIARLEGELGLPLLERTGRGVALTEYGLRLAAHAERIRYANLDIQRELAELSTGEAGHLRIGTGMVLAQHLLPIACVRLLQRHPKVSLEITGGNTETLFDALKSSKVDVVLSSIAGSAEVGFEQTPLLEDEVAIIARVDHPLHQADGLAPSMLARADWALPASRTLPGEWLTARCRDLGLPELRCAVRTGTLPTLLRIVADTDLLAFQSWTAVKRTNDFGQLIKPLPLDELIWRRTIGATYRSTTRIPPLVERFIRILQEEIRSDAGPASQET